MSTADDRGPLLMTGWGVVVFCSGSGSSFWPSVMPLLLFTKSVASRKRQLLAAPQTPAAAHAHAHGQLLLLKHKVMRQSRRDQSQEYSGGPTYSFKPSTLRNRCMCGCGLRQLRHTLFERERTMRSAKSETVWASAINQSMKHFDVQCTKIAIECTFPLVMSHCGGNVDRPLCEMEVSVAC